MRSHVGMGLVALLLGLGLVACNDGAFEEAGENIDEAFEDTGEAFDDLGDEIDEAADEVDNEL